MPIEAAALALAGAVSVRSHCDWSHPASNRFTGDIVTAVDHYADIPADARDRLKARMATHQYDDRVLITREAIQGQGKYEPGIRGMHFGKDRICRTVDRRKWPRSRKLEGLVYCDSGYCVLVPSVCGNLSRITRTAPPELDISPAAGPPSEGSPSAGGLPAAAVPLGGPSSVDGADLVPTDPPAAGVVPPVPNNFTEPPVYNNPPPTRPVYWPITVIPPVTTVVVTGPVVPEPSSLMLWLYALGVSAAWKVLRLWRGRSAVTSSVRPGV